MKKLFFSALLIAHLSAGCIASADTLTPAQSAIKTLIIQMYAIDPDTFEYATFGAKYKKGKEVVEGKYDPDRQCMLLAEYLVKEIIIKKTKGRAVWQAFDILLLMIWS